MTSDVYLHAGENDDFGMVKFLHRSGIPWNDCFTETTSNFEILMFAYENGCSWHPQTFVNVNYGDLKMLQLFTQGCPWNPNAFQKFLLFGEKATVKVFRFLQENGCPWDKKFSQTIIETKNISFLKYLHESGLPYENDLLALALTQQRLDGVKYIIESKMRCKRPKNFSQKIIEMKDVSLLIFICGSGLPYENNLLELSLRESWFDGVKYIIESQMRCERPTDLGSVVCDNIYSGKFECHDFEILKYLKSTGMEWGESDSLIRGIVSFLSQFEDRLEVFLWAIESNCLDEESDNTFYWAFHSWFENPSDQQIRDILSYLQKQGVPQGIKMDAHYH